MTTRTPALAIFDNSVSEAAFQRQVIALAQLCGWAFCYHTRDSRGSARGFPDLVLMRVRPPRLLVVELKSARGKVTDAQADWLAAFDACGVERYVWRPSDWPAIEAVLAPRPDAWRNKEATA